jgi:hypothetical protein
MHSPHRHGATPCYSERRPRRYGEASIATVRTVRYASRRNGIYESIYRASRYITPASHHVSRRTHRTDSIYRDSIGISSACAAKHGATYRMRSRQCALARQAMRLYADRQIVSRQTSIRPAAFPHQASARVSVLLDATKASTRDRDRLRQTAVTGRRQEYGCICRLNEADRQTDW